MGTQDILLYDSRAVPENCPKLVLPSPAVLYRERLKPLLAYKRDIFLDGSIIGGGGLISALTAHIRSGFSVFMTQEAALSLRNDLEEVKAMGIQIVEKVPPGFSGEHLTLKEIDFTTLAALLSPWDIDLGQTEIAAIAVQDHGVSPPGMSNRYSRIQGMKEKLKGDPRPTHFAFLPGGDPFLSSAHASGGQSISGATESCPALAHGYLLGRHMRMSGRPRNHKIP